MGILFILVLLNFLEHNKTVFNDDRKGTRKENTKRQTIEKAVNKSKVHTHTYIKKTEVPNGEKWSKRGNPQQKDLQNQKSQ